VWICPSPRGHIQAVGRDAKGRKQYRYHPDWRADRDQQKFERMAAFGRALPRLRKRVEADLALRGLPREKVLAAVVRLLELTLIRVGNDEYARTNKSFGLTTMQKRHVRLASGGSDVRVSRQERQGPQDRLPGQAPGADHPGLPGAARPAPVQICRRGRRTARRRIRRRQRLHPRRLWPDISAKDFRTWAGSLAAMEGLGLLPPSETKAAAKRSVNTCVKAVAGLLGNTPAVCRAAYIHPRVLAAYEAGELPMTQRASARARELALLRLVEA
jgi:DNA topoisomerase-1